MKKSILSVPVYIIFLFLVVTLISCNKENPITPPPPSDYQFDSARYRWKVTELPHRSGYFVDPWAPDTNEIFLPNVELNNITHIKNDQINIIDFGDSVIGGFMSGFSPNEGYYICIEVINGLGVPLLKRWNGNSFIDIHIKYDLTTNFVIGSALFKSPTEMWFSASSGIIHKYDGVVMTHYHLPDTNVGRQQLFYDENNHLKILTTIFNTTIDTLQFDRIYEFNGNSWEKVYEDRHYYYLRGYGVMNNDVYVYNFVGQTISKLIGNSLNFITEIPKNNDITMPLGGSSVNDFSAFEIRGGNYLLNWNGKKWSKEYFIDDYDRSRIIKADTNFYCAVTSGFVYTARLFRGIKKTNNFKNYKFNLK
jgi:hypothetical protein